MKHVTARSLNPWWRAIRKTIPVITLGLLIAISSRAQNESCLPDCPTTPFGPTQYITLEVCPGVYVSVEYAWRIACGIWYDYSIERVGGMPYSCVQSLGGVDQLLRKVSELLIIANPAGFPPLNKGECETNWRVLKGSCWRPDIALGVPVMPGSVADPDIFYPCSPTDCCLEHYTVCIDQNGDRIITNTGYLPPEDPGCLEDAPYHDEFYRCHPVCGSIYNR